MQTKALSSKASSIGGGQVYVVSEGLDSWGLEKPQREKLARGLAVHLSRAVGGKRCASLSIDKQSVTTVQFIFTGDAKRIEQARQALLDAAVAYWLHERAKLLARNGVRAEVNALRAELTALRAKTA